MLCTAAPQKVHMFSSIKEFEWDQEKTATNCFEFVVCDGSGH